MTIDISRQSFRPNRNRTGVVMEQGRVQLDADWNEWLEIVDRRWRSESIDVLGRTRVSPDTPGAFLITDVAGDLVIGRGRLYVDGLVAENHGIDPQAYDPVLEELAGTKDTPYEDQPWRPGLTAPVLPVGQHMVYLDVWRRIETYLQTPDLVEIAVGVDTTARTQTVWQVRILENVGGNVVCTTPDGDIPGWASIIAPSAGRLTTRNVLVPDPDDPCLLPPGSGYRGLENRTYRIEVHDQAADGTWRFKWSGVNGIVASSVVTVDSATTLTLSSIARDDVLRFQPGDWVEILDDRYELEAQPGVMRRLLNVDPATNRITLETALPAGAFPVDAQNRPDADWHMRVRKWDQNGEVRDVGGALLADLTDPNGPGVIAMPVMGAAMRIEPGIEIEFDLADPAGSFRQGDYWIFTARTTNAAIEELTAEPPAGIHHHYCRLAIVESNGQIIVGDPIDCRPTQPEVGACCCIALQPGDDINAAIAQLPDAGGCICLTSGVYALDGPVRIDRSNITLAGEARGAILLSREGPALEIGGGKDVECIRVDSITLQAAGEAVIEITAARDVRLTDLSIRSIGDQGGVGLLVYRAQDITLAGSDLEGLGLGVGVLTGSDTLDVIDNDISLTGQAGQVGISAGVYVRGSSGRTRVVGNRIQGGWIGVVLNSRVFDDGRDGSTDSRIVGNTISLSTPQALLTVAAQAQAQALPGIDVGEDGCLVLQNSVTYGGASNIGIRSVAAETAIVENRLVSTVEEYGGAGPIAIQVGAGAAQDPAGQDYVSVGVQVRDNQVSGPQFGVAALEPRDLSVTGNLLDGGEQTLGGGVLVESGDGTLVADNVVRNAAIGLAAIGGSRTTLQGNRLEGGASAVLLSNETSATVRQNHITGATLFGVGLANGFARLSVSGNTLRNIGSANTPTALAIGVYQLLGELVIEDNEILDTGIGLDGSMSPQAYGIWSDLVLEGRVSNNLVSYSDATSLDPARKDRALIMRGYLEYEYNLADSRVSLGFPLQVLGNKFIGAGAPTLVEIQGQPINDNLYVRFERVTFSDNYCSHVAAQPTPGAVGGATVSLECRAAIVMGNHIKTTAFKIPSVDFNGATGTFVGNITAGGAVNFADFPNPQSSFNQTLS